MTAKRYIVTGGGGFVGKALCLKLKSLGHQAVALGRRSYPELEAAGVETLQCDISIDRELFAPLFRGADGVFHAAAKVDMWGPYQEFFRANVLGTRNVIQACCDQGVSKLVYTSSPSVIADGQDLRGVDESYPYPEKHLAFYPATKAQAEREVLAANGRRGLNSLALRPHLIFGPGDQHFVPTILESARRGKLPQIGSGKNRCDFTFIDDCVQAHLCAMEALEVNPAAAGRAYFISQGEPTELWWWINEVLRRSALPPVRRKVSKRAAISIAAISEFVVRLLPGLGQPILTRFLVGEMCTDHYFNVAAARNLLNFSPRYSIAQALDLTFSR